MTSSSLASQNREHQGLNIPSSINKDRDTEPELHFDNDFLNLASGIEGNHIDLSYFARKGGMQPGRYAVQVKLNGRVIDDERWIDFKSQLEQPGKLYACVTVQQMKIWWGIEVPNNKKQKVSMDDCPVGGIAELIPYAKEIVEFSPPQLLLTIPQAYLGTDSHLRTPPQMWDSGIPSLLINYNYTGNQQENHNDKNSSHFLGLNSQLNVFGWRIRDDATWHKSQGHETNWNISQAYAQHSFPHLGGGELTIGQTISSGTVGDSVSFIGVNINSDDAMLAPSFSTYSPAITGVANSPSTITVEQYGHVIYQQNVPQGPFSLTNFNRNGNGDVNVQIQDAEGRIQSFTMTQAQSPFLLRKGGTNWQISLGKAKNSQGYIDNQFTQIGMSYGAWDNITLSGSLLASKNYQATALGTGLYDETLGVFNYTVKASHTDFSALSDNDDVYFGTAHTLSWNRQFGNTSVSSAWTYNPSPHFYRYSEILSMPRSRLDKSQQSAISNGRLKNNYIVSLTQSMDEWGNLSISGSRTTRWESKAIQDNVSFSYNTTLYNIGIGASFGLNTTHQNDLGDTNTGASFIRNNRTDKVMTLNISLPLSKWQSISNMNGIYSYSQHNHQTNQQAGISGSELNGALSYSVSQGLSGPQAGNVSIAYNGNYGAINSGYSHFSDSSSFSYGLNGGVALHEHGITLGKPLTLNGGNALVNVSEVSGVNVNSGVTDWRGYALISGLTPYDINHININVVTLPGNVELDVSSKNVVPTRGALVFSPFLSHRGYRILLSLKREGDEIPFGSMVSLVQKEQITPPVTGIVGESGMVYLSGMPTTGTVLVSWGDEKDNQCLANVQLPYNLNDTQLVTLSAECH
ncbi:fimbria/pilus outer membrane usher protein [Providencia sp. PROV117]|uniref:fimbria/pilus outer membrane usher protein n=1 Tax=Providencia sp. PROV117 TaxID=2949828 RepID=UPI00234B75E9|nr:fimbria/pilus outer membrane usher protein [Providencia sp. PROV117]